MRAFVFLFSCVILAVLFGMGTGSSMVAASTGGAATCAQFTTCEQCLEQGMETSTLRRTKACKWKISCSLSPHSQAVGGCCVKTGDVRGPDGQRKPGTLKKMEPASLRSLHTRPTGDLCGRGYLVRVRHSPKIPQEKLEKLVVTNSEANLYTTLPEAKEDGLLLNIKRIDGNPPNQQYMFKQMGERSSREFAVNRFLNMWRRECLPRTHHFHSFKLFPHSITKKLY